MDAWMHGWTEGGRREMDNDDDNGDDRWKNWWIAMGMGMGFVIRMISEYHARTARRSVRYGAGRGGLSVARPGFFGAPSAP